MGMFDDVKCEMPLPDGWQSYGLQTKDFGCEMTTLFIRKDGRLLVLESDWEEVPANERPHPDPSDPLHFIGSMKAVNARWRDLDFHGVMNFYGSEGLHGAPGHVWHEYNARFTDGQCVRIDAVGFR